MVTWPWTNNVTNLNHAPNSLYSWMHWLQDLGSHTAAWIWVVSQKDWRNQASTGWILTSGNVVIQLVKNAIFVFPVLPSSAVQRHNAAQQSLTRSSFELSASFHSFVGVSKHDLTLFDHVCGQTGWGVWRATRNAAIIFELAVTF